MGYRSPNVWTIRGRSTSLFSRRATRPPRGPAAGAVRGSWCLQVHVASVFSRGVQCNVDDSRCAAAISSLSRRRRARQFSAFLGSPPWITSGSFCVLGFEFTPWVAPHLFCVLGSSFSLWVVPGPFCVLSSSSFSLGSLKCFGFLPSGIGTSSA